MTKDERSLIDQIRGYIRAKNESGKQEILPAEQIIAISQVLFICEKEFHSLEYHANISVEYANGIRETLRKYIEKNRKLEEKLRKKTYPIDREFKIVEGLKKNLDTYRLFWGNANAEINKLNRSLKNKDDEIEKLKNEKADMETESHGNLRLLWKRDEEIRELRQALENIRMEVVTQTARDNGGIGRWK